MNAPWAVHMYKGRRRTAFAFEPLQGRDREVWAEWLRRHGIDVGDTVIGAVAADDVDCFVEYFPTGASVGVNGLYGLPQRAQLEARALPFPTAPGATTALSWEEE